MIFLGCVCVIAATIISTVSFMGHKWTDGIIFGLGAAFMLRMIVAGLMAALSEGSKDPSTEREQT